MSTFTVEQLRALSAAARIEWELGHDGKRTGRWRRRQFYAGPGDARVPSKRAAAEWRNGRP